MADAHIMLTKAHNKLMRHIETRAMCGVFVSGTNEIVSDDSVPTACTDGWNKYYSKAFIESLPQVQVTGIVLHENLHVFCKHMVRFHAVMQRDAQVMNAAMDYAINAWIVNLKDKTLAQLPSSALYDPQFDDWSVQQIYTFLKSGQQRDGKVEAGGQSFKLDGHDEHRLPAQVTPQQQQQMVERIDAAIQQGAVLAGAMGLELPRIVKELLVPEVDWPSELAEYAAATVRGSEDYSFQRLSRRHLADDNYVPTLIREAPSQVVIGIDTSASIDDAMLKVWGGVVANIMESVNPESVRVLWWDTRVHAQQDFEPGQYSQIADLLKPVGGGGTRAGCVSEYLCSHGIEADCVLMLTDGWVENSVKWDVQSPTLWAVTSRKDWTPPTGRVLQVTL